MQIHNFDALNSIRLAINKKMKETILDAYNLNNLKPFIFCLF